MFRRTLTVNRAAWVAISNYNVDDSVTDPANAQANYRLNSNGAIEMYREQDGIYSSIGTWLVIGANSDYEARATVLSGSLSSGTTGSWLALSTTREWARARTTVGTASCSFTLEIRKVSDGQIVDTATITLDAEVI